MPIGIGRRLISGCRSIHDVVPSTCVYGVVLFITKGNYICAAFLDLRKAFDSLDHCILLPVKSRSTSYLASYRKERFRHTESLSVPFKQ